MSSKKAEFNKIEGIEPVGKKVLVEVITKAPELSSTLITLNEENTDTDRCNVLNIGTEVDLVEEGKTYIYRLGAGIKLTYKDVEYLLLDEKDFYAKIAM